MLQRVADRPPPAAASRSPSAISAGSGRFESRNSRHPAPSNLERRRISSQRVSLYHLTMVEDPYLSLVIPCYNEQENVNVLLERVNGALSPMGKPFEVI